MKERCYACARSDSKSARHHLAGAAFQLNFVPFIRTYLVDLGAESILEEPHYFDRDYLSEFEGYYATSARGYDNVCKRLHFFSVPLRRRKLKRALGASKRTLANLRDAYLGFCVVRPLLASPFGKTVLRWYPERKPDFPRVTESRRRYTCHIAGVPFSVEGLAWQQQDSSVSACATIALWSMLHSSAFSEASMIPTTYEITRTADEAFSSGRRAFPSGGLTTDQLGEVIKSMGLQPARIDAEEEAQIDGEHFPQFTPQRFSPVVCGLLRSGYPILVTGSLWKESSDSVLGEFVGLHAVCISGFREPTLSFDEGWGLQDTGLRYVYLHDDNLGPNVRYEIEQGHSADEPAVVLRRSRPERRYDDREYPDGGVYPYSLVPSSIFVAVHEGIRIDILDLLRQGVELSSRIHALHRMLLEMVGRSDLRSSTSMSFRFIELQDYLGEELADTLQTGTPTSGANSVLADTRPFLPMLPSPMLSISRRRHSC